jgi:hypothetical protein
MVVLTCNMDLYYLDLGGVVLAEGAGVLPGVLLRNS